MVATGFFMLFAGKQEKIRHSGLTRTRVFAGQESRQLR